MPGEGLGLRPGAACKARTENEVSAKTHAYSSYVAAKPHTRPRDARRQFAFLTVGDLHRERCALMVA